MEIGIFGIRKNNCDHLTPDSTSAASVLRGFAAGLLHKPGQPYLHHVVIDHEAEREEDKLDLFHNYPLFTSRRRIEILYSIKEGNKLTVDIDPNRLFEHHDNGRDTAEVTIVGTSQRTGKFYKRKFYIRGTWV